eukprot:TRINITY_DN32043_c0_g1_i1.p1 TRINITY_DN32043_c0_g1~~TRINITY_DN32043_c0_g1_i1.p1  ORF type:complete len:398 (+),score=61.21 TRINITY_DN32043_c0_g1_i1:99-1292(+)
MGVPRSEAVKSTNRRAARRHRTVGARYYCNEPVEAYEDEGVALPLEQPPSPRPLQGSSSSSRTSRTSRTSTRSSSLPARPRRPASGKENERDVVGSIRSVQKQRRHSSSTSRTNTSSVVSSEAGSRSRKKTPARPFSAPDLVKSGVQKHRRGSSSTSGTKESSVVSSGAESRSRTKTPGRPVPAAGAGKRHEGNRNYQDGKGSSRGHKGTEQHLFERGVPGYAGFVPAMVSENVVAATFAKTGQQSAEVVRQRTRKDTPKNEYSPPFEFKRTGAIQGYSGHIPFRDETVGQTSAAAKATANRIWYETRPSSAARPPKYAGPTATMPHGWRGNGGDHIEATKAPIGKVFLPNDRNRDILSFIDRARLAAGGEGASARDLVAPSFTPDWKTDVLVELRR